MWATWLIATLGATVGALILVVGLAFGGWPVLIAFGVFAAVAAVMLAGAAWRRSGEYVERGDEGEASTAPPSRDARSTQAQPRSGGAPASGEGS
jgi:high-affinity Fe2+/Pb2+ permease